MQITTYTPEQTAERFLFKLFSFSFFFHSHKSAALVYDLFTAIRYYFKEKDEDENEIDVDIECAPRVNINRTQQSELVYLNPTTEVIPNI